MRGIVRKILIVIVQITIASFLCGCNTSTSADHKINLPIETADDVNLYENETQTTGQDDEQTEFQQKKQSMLQEIGTSESFAKANLINTSSYVPYCEYSEYSHPDMFRLDNGSLCFSWDYEGIPCIAKWENNQWFSYFGEPLTKENVMVETKDLTKNIKILDYEFSPKTGIFVFAGYDKNMEKTNHNVSEIQELMNFGIYFARWNGKYWVNASNMKFTLERGLVVASHFYQSWGVEIFKCKTNHNGNPTIAWQIFNDAFEKDDFFNENQNSLYYAVWSDEGWKNISGLLIDKNKLDDVMLNTSSFSSLEYNPTWHVEIIDYGFGSDGCITFLILWDFNMFFARHNGNCFENLDRKPFVLSDLKYLSDLWIYNLDFSYDKIGNMHVASCKSVHYERNRLVRHEITYMKWNGKHWVNDFDQLATEDNTFVRRFVGWADGIEMVLDKNDRPCLVWQDAVADSWEIYFARWNGKMWTNAAGNYFTAQNGNVSKNKTDSKNPSIILDEKGNPIICWEDRFDGRSSTGMESFIFVPVVRWDGSKWVSVVENK